MMDDLSNIELRPACYLRSQKVRSIASPHIHALHGHVVSEYFSCLLSSAGGARLEDALIAEPITDRA